MRIAWVTETYPPELNGVALTVQRAVTHLRDRGHDVRVFRPRQLGDEETAAGASGDYFLPGLPIPMYPALRFGLSRPATLRRAFVAADAELVHVATEGPLGWAAAQAARQLGLPVTSDFRTNFHDYAGYYGLGWLAPAVQAYLRRFHNGTARSFAPTRETRDRLMQSGFERVHVVGRGVDTARFSPQWRCPDLRAHWRAGEAPVLLCVGRLAAEKNVALALRAYRAVRSMVPGARMVVVGTGPLQATLTRQFPEVDFVGEQRGDALARHYASADLFLFPSVSDTFGNVVLEALASGLPVVAFNMAAAAEHVRERVSGRLALRGDEHAFVIAACMLAQQPQELAAMRPHARAAARQADWASVLFGFEDQLTQALHGHAAKTLQGALAL